MGSSVAPTSSSANKSASILPNTNDNTSMMPLPTEVFFNIFSFFITFKDVHSFLLTSRHFYEIASNLPFWKESLERFRPFFVVSLDSKNPRDECARIVKREKNIKINITTGYSEKTTKKIDKKIRIETAAILAGGMGIWEVHFLRVQKHKAYFWCQDKNSIEVWDMKNAKHLGIFIQGVELVTFFEEDEAKGKAYIGHSTGLITIWKHKGIKPDKAWTGHTDAITHGILDKRHERFYSSSKDGTVKMWDVENEPFLMCSFDFGQPVEKFDIQNNQLYAGLNDGSTVEWDSNKNAPSSISLQTFDKLFVDNKKIIAIKDMVIFSDADKGIVAQDLTTKNCIVIDPKLSQKEIQLVGMYEGCLFAIIHPLDIFFDNPTDTHLSVTCSFPFKVYDFNLPRFEFDISRFNVESLEENRSILKEMLFADYDDRNREIESIAKKLHPHFQERLKQYAFKHHGSFTFSKYVMECVQREVCLELLLHCLCDDEPYKIIQIMSELENINFSQQAQEKANQMKEEKWRKMQSILASTASLEHKKRAVIDYFNFFLKQWGPDLSLPETSL